MIFLCSFLKSDTFSTFDFAQNWFTLQQETRLNLPSEAWCIGVNGHQWPGVGAVAHPVADVVAKAKFAIAS